jgi:hypothetical protein
MQSSAMDVSIVNQLTMSPIVRIANQYHREQDYFAGLLWDEFVRLVSCGDKVYAAGLRLVGGVDSDPPIL